MDDDRLFIKLLASNAAAGSIIGKMGVNIHRTQTATGARIQLSKPAQLFPGTKDRTLLIQGNLCQLASAVYSIFIRLIEEDCAPIWSCPADQGDGSGSDRRQMGQGSQKDTVSTSSTSTASTASTASTTSNASTASTEDASNDSLGDDTVPNPGRQSAGRCESAGLAGGNCQQVDAGAGGAGKNQLEDPNDADPKGAGKNEAENDSGGNAEGRHSEDRKTVMDLSDFVQKAPLQVKLLIPEQFIGYIVGRSGVNVANICTTTHTMIKVFPQLATANLTHQIVSIRGHLVDIIKAISMIVLKQADDREYYGYANIPHSYLKRPLYGSPMMPMYHPNPGMVGYLGSNMMPGIHVPHDMHAAMGVTSHMRAPTYEHAAGPGGEFVSMVVPLVPEQQSELLKNMGAITQTIQVSTGILLKLESIPGHAGFSVRLDGPREYVLMAINILIPQISYQTAAGGQYAPTSPPTSPPMSPPMSPPVSRDTPPPFSERPRWQTPE